jgi:hypothetical protein
MAPPRPYWKGYLKLSLVSCPIALYSATSAGERVAFRQISKKTGNRLRQQLVNEGTGEPIDPDDKGAATKSRKVSISRLMTKSSTPWRSRAATRSTSTALCQSLKSTSVTSTSS